MTMRGIDIALMAAALLSAQEAKLNKEILTMLRMWMNAKVTVGLVIVSFIMSGVAAAYEGDADSEDLSFDSSASEGSEVSQIRSQRVRPNTDQEIDRLARHENDSQFKERLPGLKGSRKAAVSSRSRSTRVTSHKKKHKNERVGLKNSKSRSRKTS